MRHTLYPTSLMTHSLEWVYTKQRATYPWSFHIIDQMRDICYPQSCPILLNRFIYIDGTCVLTVSLVVGKPHARAPVHDLRARWGLNLCRRHRGEHRVIYWDRDRGTRRAAICGRIRCIGSVWLLKLHSQNARLTIVS